MTTKIPICIVTLLLVTVHAKADVVKFVTNDWNLQQAISRSCKLERIDNDIAYFSYLKGDSRERFVVNVSRILSVAFDSNDSNPTDFPPTRQDLRSALPTTNDLIHMHIELSNDDDIGASLSPNILVKPSRSSPVLTLHGRIISMNGNSIKLGVLDASRTERPLSVDRTDFRKWIR